jgi:UDP-N-acetylglucosamine 2-epimerase (non-hydrolysing)
LLYIIAKIQNDGTLAAKLSARLNFIDPCKKLILVTAHRRENFGKNIQEICQAIASLAERSDVQIVYPVHLNPNIKQPVYEMLANKKNVFLLPPQDYLTFVYLMNLSYVILTDSGGIQEEAPSLNKPVLIMRDETERIEGVLRGVVKLVGTTSAKIISKTKELLENPKEYVNMQKGHNPYGDGKAAERIVTIIREKFS